MATTLGCFSSKPNLPALAGSGSVACRTETLSDFSAMSRYYPMYQILDNISVQINEKNEYLPEAVQKLFEVMEYNVPYTSNALIEKLGLKAKEGFRRNYLRPAIEMNLIQMTLPDKPNSRNQRYVRK